MLTKVLFVGFIFSFLSVFPPHDYTLPSMVVLLHDKQNNNNPYRNDIQTMQIIKLQKLMGIIKKYILSYTVWDKWTIKMLQGKDLRIYCAHCCVYCHVFHRNMLTAGRNLYPMKHYHETTKLKTKGNNFWVPKASLKWPLEKFHFGIYAFS